MSLLTLVIPIAEHLVEQLVADMPSTAIDQLKNDVLSVAKIVLGNVETEVMTDICDYIDAKVMAKMKALNVINSVPMASTAIPQ